MVILSITMIPASTINSHWRGNLQKLVTDDGIFFDNAIKTEYTRNVNGKPGIDWSSVIGININENIFQIVNNSGIKWLKKRKDIGSLKDNLN